MTILSVRNLSTCYFTRGGIVKAVDGVSFDIDKNQGFGLAGESGCGKTTIALSVTRTLPATGRITSGEILLDKQDILSMEAIKFQREVSWKRISLVFQGAMNALNPLLKIGSQIAEPIMFHEGIERREALRRAMDLLEMVGIDSSRVDSYPFELSGGMKQRAMIAAALACNPEIVIADEPTTALDVIIAGQIMTLIKDLRRRMNLSMILITHDLSTVAQTCEKLAIMYAGRIVDISDVGTIFGTTRHPYSKALIRSFPSLLAPKKRVEGISGDPPDLIDLPSGCSFHPRCPHAQEICKAKEPELREVGKDHLTACHLYEKI